MMNSGSNAQLFRKAFQTKSVDAIREEGRTSALVKSFNLFDLTCIGVGATVGSGIFVLSGLISREYAGPSLVFCWLFAGIVCCFSALSFAELSCRFPSSGSSYSFTSVTLGEWPAFIAAWCLSLECGISSSAVARSWGFKFDNFIHSRAGGLDEGISPYACVLELACVVILLCGASAGKYTVNLLTVVKIFLIVFIVVFGLSLFRETNVQEWAPMGVGGVFRGTTSCFFGFVGYDEVCCMALECKNPQKDIPRAVIGTVVISTTCYCLASLALVGMVPYTEIDPESCFPMSFATRGLQWASTFTALGELVVLPLVVFVSFLAQPRILYSMALDNLIPKWLGVLDRRGNFRNGIIFSGFVCVLIATFVPFELLDDLISAGVLVQFVLTNISLIIVRRGWVARVSLTEKAASVQEHCTVDSSAVSIHGQVVMGSTAAAAAAIVAKSGLLGKDRICTAYHKVQASLDASSCHNSAFSAELDGSQHDSVRQTKIDGLGIRSARENYLCEQLLVVYCVLSMSFSLLATYMLAGGIPARDLFSFIGVIAVLSLIAMVCSLLATAFAINDRCPEPDREGSVDSVEEKVFRVPGVPFIPLFGILLNCYLIAQLSLQGIALVSAYFLLCTLCYFAYSSYLYSSLSERLEVVPDSCDGDDSAAQLNSSPATNSSSTAAIEMSHMQTCTNPIAASVDVSVNVT